jgi:hypothetical protein
VNYINHYTSDNASRQRLAQIFRFVEPGVLRWPIIAQYDAGPNILFIDRAFYEGCTEAQRSSIKRCKDVREHFQR